MIKGLERRARYPRLGIIRLGVKKVNPQGKEYPAEVSWFVVGSELEALFGEKPTKLPVMFPSNDIEELVFPHFYTKYEGSLLAVKCDGEQAIRINKDGERTTFPCRKSSPEACECGAKALGRLNVILAHPKAPFGIFQVPVGGEQRIEDLLDELRIFRATIGKLTDIVFSLERIETVSQVVTEKGRISRKGWPVHIRSTFSALDALKLRGAAVLGLPDQSLVALEAGDETTPDDTAEVPDEETYDISYCYTKVVSFGVEADTYTAYLAGVYRGGVDNMTAVQLADQEQRIKAALGDPAKREEFVAAVRTVASKVKR